MKPLILFILSILFITSCSHIYFTEPQPKGGERLLEFPEELRGTWLKTTDDKEVTYSIHNDRFEVLSIRKDSVGNQTSSRSEIQNLTDTFRLYQSKNFYVINYKSSSNSLWEIAVIKRKSNGDIIITENNDPEFFIKRKELRLDSAEYEIDDSLRTFYALNPFAEHSLRFVSATFSGQLTEKTLKKIVRQSDSGWIFKKNGTFIERGKEARKNEK